MSGRRWRTGCCAAWSWTAKDYEKGLALYASGVLIMEKCADLLPDYFSFVKGIVDSQDLSLNICLLYTSIENQGAIPSLPVMIQLIKVCGPPVERYFNPEIMREESEQRQREVTKPDTDNLQKLLKDCMTKCGFWKDDAQVVRA